MTDTTFQPLTTVDLIAEVRDEIVTEYSITDDDEEAEVLADWRDKLDVAIALLNEPAECEFCGETDPAKCPHFADSDQLENEFMRAL